MLDLLDVRDEIAGRSTARAGVAEAAKRNVIAGGHSRRHADADLLLYAQAALAGALGAGILDDRSLPAATIAGRDVDELPERRALHDANLARAAAGAARPLPGSGASAGSVADAAGTHVADLDLLLGAR